jgi:hypothetical protein
LTYRILSVPVDGEAPYSFASPKRVADLFERKARKMGRTLEEHLLKVYRNDLERAVTASLDEVEKGHTLWKEEFEGARHLGEPFRIIIDVPGVFADHIKKKVLLRGTSIGEAIMNELNRSIVRLEEQYEQPEVEGRMK